MTGDKERQNVRIVNNIPEPILNKAQSWQYRIIEVQIFASKPYYNFLQTYCLIPIDSLYMKTNNLRIFFFKKKKIRKVLIEREE